MGATTAYNRPFLILARELRGGEIAETGALQPLGRSVKNERRAAAKSDCTQQSGRHFEEKITTEYLRHAVKKT